MMPEFAELIFAPGADEASLRVSDGCLFLNVPMPRHSGPNSESILRGTIGRTDGAFQLVERDTFLAGAAVAPKEMSPRGAASFLYDELFRVMGGMHLCRVWNYVPHINGANVGDENYREFNAGRLDAFRKHYGAEFRPRLPAASALGTQSGAMALAFLASSEKPVHFENPEQIPACDYPKDYGQQPPAFARGTRMEFDGVSRWFLAGTASIKGHLTLGQTCAEQLSLTLDNIRLMKWAMTVPSDAKADWKVFVRHARDIDECRAIFGKAYPEDLKRAMFLQADICRSCLLVEIEAVFSS